MREPERIDRMLQHLRALWHANPDQRFGQLVVNVLGEESLWLVEDDLSERLLAQARHGRSAGASAANNTETRPSVQLVKLTPIPNMDAAQAQFDAANARKK